MAIYPGTQNQQDLIPRPPTPGLSGQSRSSLAPLASVPLAPVGRPAGSTTGGIPRPPGPTSTPPPQSGAFTVHGQAAASQPSGFLPPPTPTPAPSPSPANSAAPGGTTPPPGSTPIDFGGSGASPGGDGGNSGGGPDFGGSGGGRGAMEPLIEITAPKGTRAYREQVGHNQDIKDRNYANGFSLVDMGRHNVHEQGRAAFSREQQLDEYGDGYNGAYVYDLANGMMKNVATSWRDAQGNPPGWEPIPPDQLATINRYRAWKDSPIGQEWAQHEGGSAWRGYLASRKVANDIHFGHLVPVGDYLVDYGPGGRVAGVFDKFGRPTQPQAGFQIPPAPGTPGAGANPAPATTPVPPGATTPPSAPPITPAPPAPAVTLPPTPRVTESPGTPTSYSPSTAAPGQVSGDAPGNTDFQAARAINPNPGGQADLSGRQPAAEGGGGQGGQVPTPPPGSWAPPGATPITGTPLPPTPTGNAPQPGVGSVGAGLQGAVPGNVNPQTQAPAAPRPLPVPGAPSDATTVQNTGDPSSPPVLSMSRVPRQEEIQGLPDGSAIDTPAGRVLVNHRTGHQVQLSPAGKAAYARATVSLRKRYGTHPLAEDVSAPAPPLVVGRHNFNPFSGTWVK